jgi:hypothetical protein
MLPNEQIIPLTLTYIAEQMDAEARDQRLHQLQTELRELDLQAVQRVSDDTLPEGTKALETFLSALALEASKVVLNRIITLVLDWLQRGRGSEKVELQVGDRSVEITPQTKKISQAEVHSLVDMLTATSPQGKVMTGLPTGTKGVSPEATGRKLALLIGNSEYDDAKFPALAAPIKDVQSLAEILGDVAIGGFEVTTLINESASVVQEAIYRLLKDKHPDDTLLLYFSGHGIRDARGRLFLGVKTTHTDLLSVTAIPSSFIKEEMDGSDSRRQILILDCCHSGAFAGAKGMLGASVGTVGLFEEGYGRVILTASDATQYAWEGDQIIGDTTDKSLFTHFLVQGLKTGEADSNGDGYITVNDLYSYISKEVKNSTAKQTPVKWSERVQGELIIARNPCPKPVALPSHLQRAIESDFVDVRLTAVEELRELLHGSNVGLATTARQTLEHLVNDDSRRVSSTAVTILSGGQEDSLGTGSQELSIAEKLKESEERVITLQQQLETAYKQITELEKIRDRNEQIVAQLQEDIHTLRSRKSISNAQKDFDKNQKITIEQHNNIKFSGSPPRKINIDGNLYDLNSVDNSDIRSVINNLNMDKFINLINTIEEPSILRRISNLIDLRQRSKFLEYIEERIYSMYKGKT